MKEERSIQEAAQGGVATVLPVSDTASAARTNYAEFPSDTLAAFSTISGSDLAALVASGEKSMPTDGLAEEFHSLVKQWKKKTSFHSSLGEVFTNEEYQRIMAMGRDALPLILSDLQKNPSHWFYALEKIAGRDIAADAGAKSFAEARAAWLEWGYRNNYI